MLVFPPVSINCANCNFQMGVKAPTKLITQLRCPKCSHVTPVTARPAIEVPVAPAQPTPPPAPAQAAPPPRPPAGQAYAPTQVMVDYGQLEVLADDSTPGQSFKLEFGRQTIGRGAPAPAADLAIETTNHYLSRFHCTLEVRRLKNGQLGYLVFDGIDLPDGTRKPSTNGTYLLEECARLTPPPRLKDTDVVVFTPGCTLRLGQTKLVLHVNQAAPKAMGDTVIGG